jgi:hypothetical protein
MCDTKSYQRVRSGRPTFRLVSKPVPSLSSVPGNREVVQLEVKPKGSKKNKFRVE